MRLGPDGRGQRRRGAAAATHPRRSATRRCTPHTVARRTTRWGRRPGDRSCITWTAAFPHAIRPSSFSHEQIAWVATRRPLPVTVSDTRGYFTHLHLLRQTSTHAYRWLTLVYDPTTGKPKRHWCLRFVHTRPCGPVGGTETLLATCGNTVAWRVGWWGCRRRSGWPRRPGFRRRFRADRPAGARPRSTASSRRRWGRGRQGVFHPAVVHPHRLPAMPRHEDDVGGRPTRLTGPDRAGSGLDGREELIRLAPLHEPADRGARASGPPRQLGPRRLHRPRRVRPVGVGEVEDDPPQPAVPGVGVGAEAGGAGAGVERPLRFRSPVWPPRPFRVLHERRDHPLLRRGGVGPVRLPPAAPVVGAAPSLRPHPCADQPADQFAERL